VLVATVLNRLAAQLIALMVWLPMALAAQHQELFAAVATNPVVVLVVALDVGVGVDIDVGVGAQAAALVGNQTVAAAPKL
jgi:hypothetical protein